jgi:ubiquinol-cytochrome c reductase cytochrome c subunit
MTGPALAPLPLPPQAAMAYVRHPGGVMPPYSAAILSDADLNAILTYVQSLPKTRPASAIPLLSRFAPAEGAAPRP